MSTAVGGYVFPSKTPEASLPIVQLDIGGKMFTINKEDLAYTETGNGMTYGGIQSRGDLPFSIFGDTWLKSIYAIFDVVSPSHSGSTETRSFHHEEHLLL